MANGILVTKTVESNERIEFGKLTRIGPWFRVGHKKQASVLQCDCGGMAVVKKQHLFSGDIQSCGCHQRAMASMKNRTHGAAATAYVEYQIYRAMVQRCYVPTCKRYERYGGRGIKVCDRWLNDPMAFIRDMGLRPSAKHSIDRINNDGDYEPDNCRWATSREQASNNSRNVNITIEGTTKTATQWADEPGTCGSATQILGRIRRGWDGQRAVFQSVKRRMATT